MSRPLLHRLKRANLNRRSTPVFLKLKQNRLQIRHFPLDNKSLFDTVPFFIPFVASARDLMRAR